MTPWLSVLIIAKDEAADLPASIASVKNVAEEIVVLVDDSTTDDTERIAREAGCKVARRRFDDYASQRQAALELCTRGWVLWLDADERLDARAAAALEQFIASGVAEACSFRFKVFFLGRELRHGGPGSETHIRLFKRELAHFVGGALHEGLEVGGRVAGPMEGFIEHTPYRDLSEYLSKLDRYTTLAARKKLEAGRRSSRLDLLLLPWELFRRVVLRLAFLDGWQGLTWAGLSAFHHWLKYAKLKEMECSNQ